LLVLALLIAVRVLVGMTMGVRASSSSG
jgi:hypothetical protein